MSVEKQWEVVVQESNGGTSRLKVDGGYLYQNFAYVNDVPCMSMCFVPDVDLTRYQAHLRDAYKQGFIDGGIDAHAQYRQAATVKKHDDAEPNTIEEMEAMHYKPEVDGWKS